MALSHICFHLLCENSGICKWNLNKHSLCVLLRLSFISALRVYLVEKCCPSITVWSLKITSLYITSDLFQQLNETLLSYKIIQELEFQIREILDNKRYLPHALDDIKLFRT